MGAQLRAIWQSRYFWLSLVKLDLVTRYRRSILGVGWSLLNPIAMTVILCIAFTTIFHQDVRNYAPFLLTGLTCWNFVQTAVLQGCDCLFHGEKYIRQHPLPLAVYPLRTAIGGMIHFLLSLVVVFGLVGCLKGFGNVPALLSLVPTIVLMFLLGWSLAVLAGLANVFFNDVKHLVEIGFQFLFYLTPVMYAPANFPGRRMEVILCVNPLTSFLDLMRLPLLKDQVPPLATFATAGVTVLVAVGVAALALRWLERRLIFYL